LEKVTGLKLFLILFVSLTYLLGRFFSLIPETWNLLVILALLLGGSYLILPSLGDANRFIRSIRRTIGIGCPHGFMDNDLCPNCSPPETEDRIAI